LLQLLKPHFHGQILGPEFPLVSKIKNQYYKKLLIKTHKHEPGTQIRQKIYDCINELHSRYKKWNFRVQPDVDPI
jgi:primosomal protein N' (replication factor Y)